MPDNQENAISPLKKWSHMSKAERAAYQDAKRAAYQDAKRMSQPTPVQAEEPVKVNYYREPVVQESITTTDEAPEPAVPSTTSPPVETLQSEIERIRKTRKPFGSMSRKLALPEKAGYHRHWFNDVPGRIEEALTGGWAHVPNKEGQPVKRVVGTGRDGGALYAFAMEIPLVFWEEDQAALHAQAKAVVDDIKSAPIKSRPGESKPQDNAKFYSPRENMIEIERK